MVGAVSVGRTIPHHNRYFTDSLQPHQLEGREAVSSPVVPYRKPPVCFFCFEEGHESSKCTSAGVFCNTCGGEGHGAEDCPLYFMELSIRGQLTAYIQQRSQQAEQRRANASDKGRFPAQDPESLRSSSSVSSGSDTMSAVKRNARRLTFSAVQCIVCGCMGHANCSSPPRHQGVCHCPRCSHPGHTAAECPRYTGGRQHGIFTDTSDRKSSSWGVGANKVKSPKLHKTKWQKQREAAVARAAAADPWHPLHLQS